ncbi:hypothetical protein FLK61_26055 [Paenalkalicoccus suaedae]|uniref:Phage protein n=1 Tax=Paenalkalicoccus suaedae TaxID=2592382 RepID=A0A859FB40_9BACI|nr:hypothetical protein [Paenalkalicoccus suaedae]QKS70227.1 hypothetical protein FLK61_26055 [Paenalkalicoccus suaedae]
MIKEAIKYIVDLGNKEAQVIEGRHYTPETLYPVELPRVNSLEVNTLSGLVDYIQSEFDSKNPLMIHVVSPQTVKLFDAVNQDAKRNTFIVANALTPSFNFDHYYDVESFNIKLQSVFVANDDRDSMLRLVGNVKEESVNEYGDDGITQSVTAKTGVAQVGTAIVPNPVTLAPYRTFLEIKQPESHFVFRMQSGPKCALFEADGGAWKLNAMKDIATYLRGQLSEEIEKGSIKLIV